MIVAAALMGLSIEDEDDIPENVREVVDIEIELAIESSGNLYIRYADGGDIATSIPRIVAQIMRVFYFALLFGLDEEQMLTWVADPAKESCITCIEQNGQTRTVSEWRELAERGIYPKSLLLACTGRYCGCTYESD